jgi:hypothetical protein
MRLRDAAVAFDRRVRRGITAGELANLEGLLARLATNVEANDEEGAPWAGLIDSSP